MAKVAAPKALHQFTPEEMAFVFTKQLQDEELQDVVSKRILQNNVTGAEVLRMIEQLYSPGSCTISEHPTFRRIFSPEDETKFARSAQQKTVIRNAQSAMRTFFSTLINENSSITVAEAQKKIYEIIDHRRRKYEFDAFYNPDEVWCIASGTPGEATASHNGGRLVEGFYTSPGGWTRLGLEVLDDCSKNFTGEEWTSWHKAYHGTRGTAVSSIVSNGLLQPGAVINGVKVENQRGAAGAIGGKVPIYATPSLEYAANFIYTGDGSNRSSVELHGVNVENDANKLTPSLSGLSPEEMLLADGTYVQFVFEVRVKPGTYRVQGNTIGTWPRKSGKYKGPYPATQFMPYDDVTLSQNLEWLIEDSGNVVCTGVMVRQLPHSLKEQNEHRIAYMRKLTGFTEEEGCTRPRDYCNGTTTLTPQQVANGVVWEFNIQQNSTLSYQDTVEWKQFDPETSELIEKAYMQYQRFVFIGAPAGAPAPYAIHFGKEWNPDKSDKNPEQRRADADKEQEWRRRAVRRMPVR